MKNLNYEERLRKLKLPTLGYRRVRADMIEMYKITRACIVHLVIKKNNWSYVKTMSCSGSHLGITINIKKHSL